MSCNLPKLDMLVNKGSLHNPQIPPPLDLSRQAPRGNLQTEIQSELSDRGVVWEFRCRIDGNRNVGYFGCFR